MYHQSVGSHHQWFLAPHLGQFCTSGFQTTYSMTLIPSLVFHLRHIDRSALVQTMRFWSDDSWVLCSPLLRVVQARYMKIYGTKCFFLALIISSNVIKIQILKLCFFFHSSPFSRMLHTCVFGGYTYIHTAHIHSQKTQTCICWITYGNEYTRACLCVYIPYIFCMWSWDTVNEKQSSIHEVEERWGLMDTPIEAWLMICRIMDLSNSEIVRSRNMGMISDTSLLLFLLADII